MKGWDARFFLCSGLAIVGGGFLGGFYGGSTLVITGWPSMGLASLAVAPLGVLYGAVLGSFVGFITSPIPAFLLMHKQLSHAWLITYGGSAMVILVAYTLFPNSSLVITFIGWLVICIGVCLVLPRKWSPTGPPAHLCRSCGYDLRGLTAQTCPECGNAVASNRSVSDA